MQMYSVQIPNRRKFVLIDDDPLFCSIMRQTALREGTDLDVYNSSMFLHLARTELSPDSVRGHYDGAIIDFDLGSTNGIDAAMCLTNLFGAIPILLISEKPREDAGKEWPSNIVRFHPKSDGYSSILKSARNAAKGIESNDVHIYERFVGQLE